MTSLDAISKSVAAFAILLYGCGYLITSIYYSGYGFTEMAPLRPRIVAAGAWFLLFTSMAFVLAKGVLKSADYLKVPGKSWLKVPAFLLLHLVACTFLAFLIQWIFDVDTYSASAWSGPKAWEAWTPWVLLLPLMTVGLLSSLRATKRLVSPALGVVSAIATVASFIWSSVYEWFVAGSFGWSAIALWFFAIGILALLEMHMRRWKVTLTPGDWTQTIILVLGTVFIFASFYYPHIKSSWGGGRPIPVTIYFTKESVILPGHSVNALLIDESDSGLYVVGNKDKKATFIPHGSVGLVYFSDNVSDFSLSKPK
jgi:hypothetical protein